MKEREEELKRCEGLFLFAFFPHYLVSINTFWFHRLREEVEACQAEDPDVRRQCYF